MHALGPDSDMTEFDFSGDRQLAETLLSGFAGDAGRRAHGRRGVARPPSHPERAGEVGLGHAVYADHLVARAAPGHAHADGGPAARATSSHSAVFALPSTGGAVTRITTAPARSPTTSVRRDRGCRRTRRSAVAPDAAYGYPDGPRTPGVGYWVATFNSLPAPMPTSPHAERVQAPAPRSRRTPRRPPERGRGARAPPDAADRGDRTRRRRRPRRRRATWRFASPKRRLTDAEIDFLVDVDDDDHEALAALDPVTGEGARRWCASSASPAIRRGPTSP